MEITQTLRAGLSVAALRRPQLELHRIDAGQFWGIAGISITVQFVLTWIMLKAPGIFEINGLQTIGLNFALALLLGFIAARSLRAPPLMWQLPTLTIAAGIVVSAVYYLLSFLVGYETEVQYYVQQGLYVLAMIWTLVMTFRIIQAGAPDQSLEKRVAMSVVATVLPVALVFSVYQYPLWDIDYAAQYASEQASAPRVEPLIAEDVLYRQPEMLSQAISELAEETPGKPDLYFLPVGSYSGEDVFMKEVKFTIALFNTRFGTEGRTLPLINNRQTLNETPMATVTNLRAALKGIAAKMNIEEDILFMFLTSHGSENHELAMGLENISLKQLPAQTLADIIGEAGIKWKVVVVSACYSGGFIKPLENETSLIITAARPDRTSFGCGADNDFTYFGRAYFERALAVSTSFSEAFTEASTLVAEWEVLKKVKQSEPQISSGALIEGKLREWEDGLTVDQLVRNGRRLGLP